MIVAAKASHTSIRFLAELESSQAAQFGAKSKGLVDAMHSGATVPSAFAICPALAARIAEADDIAPYVRLLAPFVDSLLQGSVERKMIVRSSSIFEDDLNGLFPGLFDSYRDQEDTGSVVDCIIKIVNNAKISSLESYYKRFSRDINSEHMAVIVQQQVDCEAGGIVQLSSTGALVEFALEKFNHAIAGSESLYSFEIGYDGGLLTKLPNLAARHFAERFYHQFIGNRFWADASARNLCIEFCFKGDTIYVLQQKTAQSVLDRPASFGALELANKTFAMDFFVSQKLFTKESLIIRSGWRLRDVEDNLHKIFLGNTPITIRFASGSCIGLPRAFASSTDEAINFIQAYGSRRYDIILHEYLEVVRSFEILVDHDSVIIEHVPGMWESPNNLQPDVIVCSPGQTTIFRYQEDRCPVLDPQTVAIEDVAAALSADNIKSFKEMGWQVHNALARGLEDHLPLNVHAIWDGGSRTFQCLNIRPGFPFPKPLTTFNDLYVVRKVSDLAGWDGCRPVRLTLTTNRGDERSLIAVARRLSETALPIVVDFGLLSHPAMVLREYGCKLVPSYLIPACFAEQEYEVLTVNDDYALDPVNRILAEPACAESAYYHVVRDREPLAAEHFLCVATHHASSAVDTGATDEIQRLYEVLSQGRAALFYERGRAGFCTSGFTAAHDHFHILSGLDVFASVEALRAVIGGSKHKDLATAYEHAPQRGEYTIYGSPLCGFYLRTGAHGIKRALKLSVRA